MSANAQMDSGIRNQFGVVRVGSSFSMKTIRLSWLCGRALTCLICRGLKTQAKPTKPVIEGLVESYIGHVPISVNCCIVHRHRKSLAEARRPKYRNAIGSLFVMTLVKSEEPMDWRELKRHPLSAEYADITGPAWYRFTLTLKKLGIVGGRKIMLYDGLVLDGWQMLRGCLEVGIEPEFQTLPEGVDPREYVEAMNDERRHESPADVEARRQESVRQAMTLRDEGLSLRAIAERCYVNESTIRRYLESSGAPPSAPENVKGRDGKSYKAKKAPILCRHCEHRQIMGRPLIENCVDCAAVRKIINARPELEAEAHEDPANPNIILDDAGVPVPQRLLDVFRAREDIAKAARLLTGCSEAFKVLEHGPCKTKKPVQGSEHYRKFFPTFKAARERLKSLEPSVVCESCSGDGCLRCQQDGWLSKEEVVAQGAKT